MRGHRTFGQRRKAKLLLSVKPGRGRDCPPGTSRIVALTIDTWEGPAYTQGMVIHLTPEQEAELRGLAEETGRPADELVQDAVAGYLDRLAQVRRTLDSRYDDIKSGKVKLIDGEEAFTRLRGKSDPGRTDRA